MRLLSTAGESKDVGWITSVASSSRVGKQIALGFVKRGYQDIGLVLHATHVDRGVPTPLPVEIAALPFV
jgi:glycine cleavage system aminomethyltransferase T